MPPVPVPRLTLPLPLRVAICSVRDVSAADEVLIINEPLVLTVTLEPDPIWFEKPLVVTVALALPLPITRSLGIAVMPFALFARTRSPALTVVACFSGWHPRAPDLVTILSVP
jgi:hypothetical protein